MFKIDKTGIKTIFCNKIGSDKGQVGLLKPLLSFKGPYPTRHIFTLSLARPLLAHFTPLIKTIPLKFASISNSTPWSWLIFTRIGRRKLIRYCKCSNLLLLKVSFKASYNSCHQLINHRQKSSHKKDGKKSTDRNLWTRVFWTSSVTGFAITTSTTNGASQFNFFKISRPEA